MSATHLEGAAIRVAAVRQVATLMAAAAIAAPKSGGQLFLAGKPNFLGTVMVEDPPARRDLAQWLRARGKERREAIWFRDADLNASNQLRKGSAELEFTGPTCNLRDIDLGIAVGSAAKTAALNSIDCRCQTRFAVAARKTGVITAEIAVPLSLSVTPKSIGFDRRMPEPDCDSLDLPPTGTQPTATDATGHPGAARHRRQPRRATPGHQ